MLADFCITLKLRSSPTKQRGRPEPPSGDLMGCFFLGGGVAIGVQDPLTGVGAQALAGAGVHWSGRRCDKARGTEKPRAFAKPIP